MAASSLNHHIRVDTKIWRLCAEPFLFTPLVNSRVYYFPEGHGLHSGGEDVTPSLMTELHPSSHLCEIVTIDYLADAESEEFFLQLTLKPVVHIDHQEPILEDGNIGVEGVVLKLLTPTDVNTELRLPTNGNDVFSDHVGNDGDSNTCVEVCVKDLRNTNWRFHHIHQQINRRYVLSAGWRNFIKEKKLVVDDSVIFLKKSDRTIFVGIRRKSNIAAKTASEKIKIKNDQIFDQIRVNSHNVMKVLTHIVNLEPFEVQFYPGFCDFLVDPNYIEASRQVVWFEGMRVTYRRKDQTSITGRIVQVYSQPNQPNDIRWGMLKVIVFLNVKCIWLII
ncbi:unnamed protein product [Lathyrus oleraceus]